MRHLAGVLASHSRPHSSLLADRLYRGMLREAGLAEEAGPEPEPVPLSRVELRRPSWLLEAPQEATEDELEDDTYERLSEAWSWSAQAVSMMEVLAKRLAQLLAKMEDRDYEELAQDLNVEFERRFYHNLGIDVLPEEERDWWK